MLTAETKIVWKTSRETRVLRMGGNKNRLRFENTESDEMQGGFQEKQGLGFGRKK
jgi:hypothetical protein